MVEFKAKQIVSIVNLNDYSAGDFGMEESEFTMYREIFESNGASIVGEACEGYWNVVTRPTPRQQIQFKLDADPIVFEALSVYHIVEMSRW